MATQLETVNRVLRRLREDTVSTVNENEYSTLIAEFVNAAMEDTRDEHVWERFKTITFTQVLPQFTRSPNVSKTTADGGDILVSYPVFDEYTKLTWTGHECPIVGARLDGDVGWRWLSAASLEQGEAIYQPNQELDSSKNTDEFPQFFSFGGPAVGSTPFNGEFYLHLWPNTDSDSLQLVIHAWFPQSMLALDGTDDSTEILYPHRVVYHHALLMALNERGEEIGEPGNLAEQQYLSALHAAIENDIEIRERSNEFDWRRD